MPVKSQQRRQTDQVRTNIIAGTTPKTTPSTRKRDVALSKSNSSETRTSSCLSIPIENNSKESRHHKPMKIITEVDETNIDEILNLSDLSRVPTTFLTEIRQDKVYGTILKEIQKKLPPQPPITLLEQEQQKSLPSHQLNDDIFLDYDTNNTNDILSSASSEDPTSSQDGYDTDIESEIIISSDHDITGRAQYHELCVQSKIVPCSYFMAHIQDKEMILRHHQFNTDDIRAIAKALSSNISIERLFLDGNYLQQQAATYLSEMIVANEFITELSLADNRLGGGAGGVGTIEICKMLTLNRNLKKINLSGNQFNDLDANLLIEAFEHNKTLRELNLSHNCFGEECGKILGAFISGNESLEAIDLSWNKIRGRSAIDVAHGIKENVRLKRCNLEMNGFGPDGGQILADCIQQNAALEEFNISSNRLNTPNAFTIAKALLANDSLQVLKIADNQINSDGALAIFLCVKTNESSIIREVDFSHTVVTQEVLDTCEDIVRLKDGKFRYRTGKVTPKILQPNSISECYIPTDEQVLNKLRSKAANAKLHAP
ncbi:unnamed protein product [Adineta steineri]|uniref:Uncharacterized protein n=1 Tax=Adineta steineri TaxID=433720 RepID=A0A815KW66_9BILA|nr:unnamed protein product [Adineta steineri]CAF3933692.1 unnamed protein product [Adineta steineri]